MASVVKKLSLAIVLAYFSNPFGIAAQATSLDSACRAAIEANCTSPGSDGCAPLFFNLEPRPVRYIDELIALRSEIILVSAFAGITPDLLVASLIAVQAKLGNLPGAEGLRQGQSNPDTAANPAAGLATGADTGLGTGLGTGLETGQAIGLGTGLDTGLDTGLGTGQALGLGTGLATGLDTGLGEAGETLRGARNIARLSDSAIASAEAILAQLERRPVRSRDEAVALAYANNHYSLLLAAVLIARNQRIFTLHNLPMNPPIAATLFGLAEIERVAERIQRERRQPRLNSWGVYALCQSGAIAEILGR